jgi:hypothetical protein
MMTSPIDLAASAACNQAEPELADRPIADPGLRAASSDRDESLLLIDSPRAPCDGGFDLPAEFLRVLHPAGRRGLATLVRGGEEWNQRSFPVSSVAGEAEALAGETDIYVSYQTFHGPRRIANLAQLGSCYVDLDYHNLEIWRRFGADHVTHAVLVFLDDEGLPSPSYVLSTGRGLLVVWLHDLVPKHVLPRWKAIQRHLAKKLESFGADLNAIDAARVFRLVGSRNSKSKTLVRPTYVRWTSAGVLRWNFEELSAEILPTARSTIAAWKVRRAKRIPGSARIKPARTLGATTYWDTVYADLLLLLDSRWSGRLPPGHRDIWLFVTCVALSWTVAPSQLRREFQVLASKAASWGEGECGRRMTTIFHQVDAVLAGRKGEWQGRQVDLRYRMRASTIIDWLGITEVEMRSLGLRVLVTEAVAKERAAERQLACRRRLGIIPRTEFERSAAMRHDEAARLRSSGLSWRDVASALGLPSADAARMSASRARPKPQANASVTVNGGVAQASLVAGGFVSPVPEGNRYDPDPDIGDQCATDLRMSAESNADSRDEVAPGPLRIGGHPSDTRQKPTRRQTQRRDMGIITGISQHRRPAARTRHHESFEVRREPVAEERRLELIRDDMTPGGSDERLTFQKARAMDTGQAVPDRRAFTPEPAAVPIAFSDCRMGQSDRPSNRMLIRNQSDRNRTVVTPNIRHESQDKSDPQSRG